MRSLLLVLPLLSGCNLVPWVAAHKAELAAVGLVAGTTAQVGGALVQADEVVNRIERRVSDGNP